MAIELVKEFSLQGIADRWKAQYFHDGKWGSTISGPAQDTHEKILQCASLDEIDKLLGEGWTGLFCFACQRYARTAINMLEPDYETTPTFCFDCILNAAEIVKAARWPKP